MSNVTVQETLKAAIETITALCNGSLDPLGGAYKTVNQCKAALADIEKCEPVKGVVIREGLPTLLSDKYIKATDIRLYTSPQPRDWVSLSVGDIKDLKNLEGANRERTATEMAFAVQAKLKQLNTKG